MQPETEATTIIVMIAVTVATPLMHYYFPVGLPVKRIDSA